MKTSLQQSAVLKQELRMNPRLYQAMDLLYMPSEEEAENTETESSDEIDWEDIILDGFEVGGARPEYEEREFYRPVAVETRSLADHLRDQLQMLDLQDRQLVLADEFIGNIGDDGYLRASLEEILQGVNAQLGEGEADDDSTRPYSMEEIEEMLRVTQHLDPPGIGARDLRECLLLQLENEGEQGSLAYRLVDEAFDDLINHRWTELAKRYGLEPKEVQAAADELARLDPKPGLQFAQSGEGYVVPDLVVDKIDGEYRVFLNDGGMPRLRISKIYQEIAGDKKKFVGESREFITQKLNSATWLIQAIEQRRQTMLKVMHFIVDRQREFFEKGVEQLKPLTLREVAEVVEMHESTVSRVTSQKYVQTPRGVYPLKFFFSSSLGTTTGEDASSRAVKAQIAKLVSDEDSARPLTDAAVVEQLKQRGVRIARRTVAKYREQLGILPARMRKRV